MSPGVGGAAAEGEAPVRRSSSFGRKSSKSKNAGNNSLDVWQHLDKVEESIRLKNQRESSASKNKSTKEDPGNTESNNNNIKEDKEGKEGNDEAADKNEAENRELNEKDENLKSVLIPKSEAPDSTYFIFVGDRTSGKSTVISSFLNPAKHDEKPKPTVALEYTFGRKTNASGDRKDLCQIWELGGGDQLVDLIPIVLTKQREKQSCAIIVLDLSKPDQVFESSVKWTKIIRGISKKIPLLLIGTKYDVFKEQDGLKKKALCQALRYVACAQRAGLLFVSKSDKTALNYARAILNHYAFHTEKKRSLYVDPNKPLVVAPGRDKIEKIGLPSGMTPDAPAKKILNAWLQILKEYFPAQEDGKSMDDQDELAVSEHGGEAEEKHSDKGKRKPSIHINLIAEPNVDKRKKEKDVELEQYRAQVARRQRLEKSR